ncbi:MAG: hypothetical protein JWL68_2428 [Actinomycetia bacterium]|jgi:hypothetical protein|nr:hypothetical protein [Actinomycetes bacterium]
MAFLAVSTVGCAQARSAQRGESSGIRGIVTVDTGCPQVMDTPCPRRPLHARLVIRAAGSGHPVVHASSDPDGRFRVPLAPGRYTIVPLNIDNAPAPTAFPVSASVHRGAWTTIAIEFDSGVR